MQLYDVYFMNSLPHGSILGPLCSHASKMHCQPRMNPNNDLLFEQNAKATNFL